MWTTIHPNKIQDTVWEQIDDTKLEFNKDFLVQNFAQKESTTKLQTASSKKSGEAEKQPKQSLISSERSKNIDIVLGKMRLPSYQVVADALLSGDEKLLTLGNLESLLGIAPKPAELELVNSYLEMTMPTDANCIENLCNPERFFCHIKTVNAYMDRIKAYRFSKVYREQFSTLEDSVANLTRGFSNLMTSPSLKRFLEFTLGVGNYLNGQSSRGGAFAFKLDSLVQLADMKASDGRNTTLMMYIVE